MVHTPLVVRCICVASGDQLLKSPATQTFRARESAYVNVANRSSGGRGGGGWVTG